jgi:hypothetical protein
MFDLFKKWKKQPTPGTPQLDGLFTQMVDAQKRQQKSNTLRNPATGEAFDTTETYNPFSDNPYRR